MSESKSKSDSICGEEEEEDEEFRRTALNMRNDIKRRVHNGIEKRRKDKINYWIHKLAELLPFKEPKRESKTHLLENIHQYINQLKDKNENLMFGNQNTVQEIHVEEIRRLTKKCKELEEKCFNYYRLLERAGISPNGFPQDIHFERPTKYSKKISEQQLNDFLVKNSDQINGNNKRVNDFDDNCGQNWSKKSKSLKSRSKRRKEKREDRKHSTPTPVLPNTLNPNNTPTAGQTSGSTPFAILNDQNMSINAEDNPRIIVNTSGNGLNGLNTLQIRPTIGTIGSQHLQILSTNSSLDSLNTNLLSGQIVLNLNHPCPQPQPQATAVLLPNGQILPIITQPQPQHPFILAPNQSFLLAAPTPQPTIITGQTSSIANTINSNINSIQLIQNTNESRIEKTVVSEKTKEMTTTIESIPDSPKQTKTNTKKKMKRQISGSKTKNTKAKDVIKRDDKKSLEKKDIESKSSKSSDNSMVKRSDNKKEKQKCDKSIEKTNENNVNLESSELSATTPESNTKTNTNCDILAKATQSIFSPPPKLSGASKQVAINKKKEGLVSNDNNNNNNKSICDRKQVLTTNEDSKAQSIGPKPTTSEKKVNSKYCAKSADSVNSVTNTANKSLNHKNDNYIENNSKLDKSIAEGNKAEITNDSTDSTVAQTTYGSQTNSLTPEQTTRTNDSETDVRHSTEQTFESNEHNSVSTRTTAPNGSRLSFDFSSQSNQTNSNSNCNQNNGNQSIVETELPSLLLSSLNDENEVSAESVHSVSNSSLPAFLSLSPEHLNDYLPKETITNGSETLHSTSQTTHSSNRNIEFRISANVEPNVELHPTVTSHDNRIPQKQQQDYTAYRKDSTEDTEATASHTESRSSYSSNFPMISSLINNDFSDFNLNTNKSMFSTNNYSDNSLMDPKTNQNNNFIQFGLQNNNSLMPFHPIPNYLQNNTNNTNSNRSFFTSNESHSVPTVPKGQQNTNHSQTQSRTQAQTQQPKPTTTAPQQQSIQSQPQNQSNAVMTMRSQRNTSTEQLHPQQRLGSHTREGVAPNTSASNTLNKSPTNVSSAQYSTHNSFSSYSAEALIRQNEPTVQQIQSSEQNRFNSSANNSVIPRIPQQTHGSNTGFNSDSNAIRSSSRASISYSAESLIQSNPMNNSNPMANKSSQREVESESLNSDNRISYYQHLSHNNNNISNNLIQNQNNSNNLFNFDHSLNSRLMSTSSASISQNCSNSYPQITFNSHLPDIRTSTTTTTTSAEPLFAITSDATTVNSNSNRTLTSNSVNQISQSQTAPNIGNAHPQHSPILYPSSNSHQSKRSTNTNNSFNTSVNAFIHTNAESYANSSHSSVYSTTGSALESNGNQNQNHYQRSVRNSDNRFTNCLQPTNQNPNPMVSQPNNTNTGCFFSNTTANTTYFPPSSGTPFPPLLPSAASPFDTTAPFTGPHRPPMFTNSFMPDFNTSFVNTSANNPLPPIGSNFTNTSVNNNTNPINTKSRETNASNTRSSSNQSKHSKISSNNSKSNSKKQNNSKHNTGSDGQNNSSSNPSIRQSNDNYFSMNDLMSLTSNTPQTNNRYSNFLSNNQTQSTGRQPVPSPAGGLANNTQKNPTSSSDTSSSYTLFRPQSQNSTNGSNVSNVANFSVNSLQTPNRTVPTSTASNFGSGAVNHSSHATNFHLSNIFPDINTESLPLSPMKFPPPVTPVVPPPVSSTIGQSTMDVSAGTYQNHHSTGHHQNLYHSHHPSARISTPHNAFNTFLSSGSSATHNTNSHSFDPQITPNNRTAPAPQMPAISSNTSHPSATFAPTHPHSHHSSYPSFNF